MSRTIKENLLTFEGRRLFPERRAETLDYDFERARAGSLRIPAALETVNIPLPPDAPLP